MTRSIPFERILETTNQEQIIDPNNPDVDNMTYEQLNELDENPYCRGYT